MYDRVADSMESNKTPFYISIYHSHSLVIRGYPLELLIPLNQEFPAVTSGAFPAASTSSFMVFLSRSSSSRLIAGRRMCLSH